ncbi:MAG TPA: asparagine synthase (glutamine-hydrolyzing) [Candidatus Binatus sp.]|nr:asparagine synthase (glutamine-hydrolyzing) [Candidatus Binatus sp.]
MCGIAGIFGTGRLAEGAQELLKRMTRTLSHRGPDGEGYYFDEHAGLGHRRLSIIDLDAGKQPMCNEDETVWVTFNGEIYNYLDLRKDLIAKGHTFRTESDTEVIVHLYEEVGERFSEKLRGMFAIGLWDKKARRLILTRDRIGKKPLYYSSIGNALYFASEMKSLLHVPNFDREIDFEALSDYFSLLYVPAPKAIFKSVRKVKPAHYMVFDDNGMRENCYWDLSFEDTEEKTEKQWCDDFLSAYEEAVRLRLRSDVPLGAFLSGGVDSSSVVALMHQINGNRVTTCSVGFDEKAFDESAEAAEFAASLGTDHHEERVRPDALAVLDKLVWHYDEPYADSSAVPTYYVSQAARRHVTVALSGDGGDENFAGYRRYFYDCLENRARSFLPDEIRAPVFGALGRWYPKLDWAPRFLRAQATFRALSYRGVEGYFYSVSGLKPDIKQNLLSGDLQQSLKGYNTFALFEDYYNRPKTSDHLSRLQYLDIKTYLVDDILVKVDRASMANSLEVRSPLLDHVLMELIARMPSALKLKGKTGKYIFKKALEPVLPQKILTRPKQGFGVPLAEWFRKDLKETTASVLLQNDPMGLLNPKTVAELWSKHQSGLRDFSTPLWTLLMFRLWQNNYYKNGAAGAIG